jgi:hypothetical protein
MAHRCHVGHVRFWRTADKPSAQHALFDLSHSALVIGRRKQVSVPLYRQDESPANVMTSSDEASYRLKRVF